MDDREICVLLIEDNLVDAAVIRNHLATAKELTPRLEHARNLSDGLERLEASRFDVILLDLGLPETIGLETLDRVRTRSGSVPIVVLTGLEEEDIALAAVQMGADDYLSKNQLDPHLLIRAIRYADGRARRRRAEEEVRWARERFELVVHGAGVGIWDWDLRTGKIYYSPRWKELFGYKEHEIGDTLDEWTSRLHPDDRQRILDVLQEFLKSDRQNVAAEYRLRHRDGSYRWIAAHGVVLRDADGHAIRVVGSHGDVTDRKQAEQAVVDSEAKYRALYESSRDALMIFDGAEFVDCNKATLDVFRCPSKEQFLSRHPADYSPPRQGDGEDSRLAANRHIATAYEAGSHFFEWWHKRFDGTVFPAEVQLNTFQLRDKVVLQGVVRDITERKRAQESLEQDRRTLSHLLRSSDHERQLIAYEIHDGLAQHLAAAIMQFQAYSHMKEAKIRRARQAHDAAMAMLKQAHAEARRLISDVRPPILDESGIVAAIEHLVHEQRLPEGPKIEFNSKVGFGRLDSILENAVYRIVQEGLTNACKHSKSERIRVDLTERDSCLQIEIQDWGVGISCNVAREGCFGLEGIQQRARLLGGSCAIDSDPARGTRIVVDLPVIHKVQPA